MPFNEIELFEQEFSERILLDAKFETWHSNQAIGFIVKSQHLLLTFFINTTPKCVIMTYLGVESKTDWHQNKIVVKSKLTQCL
ncbi:MAG: hypothetical protein CL663_06860 [Bacteroidetes bacterium]|nr:hypothetical protein [Bacteroidota bacterium]